MEIQSSFPVALCSPLCRSAPSAADVVPPSIDFENQGYYVGAIEDGLLRAPRIKVGQILARDPIIKFFYAFNTELLALGDVHERKRHVYRLEMCGKVSLIMTFFFKF